MKRITRTLGTLATLGLSLAAFSGCSSSDGSGSGGTPNAGPTSDAPGPGECATGRSACDGLCVDEQTDDGNCGGCGMSCPTGCNAGRCTTALVSGLGAPAALALDASRLYWTDPSFGVVATVRNRIGMGMSDDVNGVGSAYAKPSVGPGEVPLRRTPHR